jgi:hypothetical protein
MKGSKALLFAGDTFPSHSCTRTCTSNKAPLPGHRAVLLVSGIILGHCRQPGVHVRGCWMVDLLLGKE